MSNIFVIPDIHGQADKLTKIIETNIHPHINTNDLIIFLGDYIDRGSQSLDVIKIVNQLKTQYPNQVITLLGNHDVDFYNRIESIKPTMTLTSLGDFNITIQSLYTTSYETLQSFNSFNIDILNAYMDVSMSNVKLFESLRNEILRLKMSDDFKQFKSLILDSDYYFETENYIFSHSGGVNYLKPEEQSPRQWLWSRDFAKRRFSDKTFVVGHTPVESIIFKNKQILMCDTGSVFEPSKELPVIRLKTHKKGT